MHDRCDLIFQQYYCENGRKRGTGLFSHENIFCLLSDRDYFCNGVFYLSSPFITDTDLGVRRENHERQ